MTNSTECSLPVALCAFDEATAFGLTLDTPAQAARHAAEWLQDLADRMEAVGAPLVAYDDVWPLLMVEAKLGEARRGGVSVEALREAEIRFFGRPLPRP